MSKTITKVIPKIVQIAAEEDRLYALDDMGNVWWANSWHDKWHEVIPLPEVTHE